MTRWDVAIEVWDSPQLKSLLADGWEPFAAAPYGDGILLRKAQEEETKENDPDHYDFEALGHREPEPEAEEATPEPAAVPAGTKRARRSTTSGG